MFVQQRTALPLITWNVNAPSQKLHDSLGSGVEKGQGEVAGGAVGAAHSCRLVTRARWKVAEGAHQF